MATIQELLDLAYQIRDAEQNGENTALRVGQFLVELVNHFNTKADVDNISGARHLKQQQAPITALMSVQQMPDSSGQDNKAWWSTDGHIKYQHNGRIYDLGTPAYMLYYCGDKIYKWTGSATGFKLMTDGGGGSSGGGASVFANFAVAASTNELPDNGVATTGYIVGQNLYAYVGTGGDTKGGKYQNLGELNAAGVSLTTNGDGTFTVHSGGNDYTVNLNHTHPNMAKLIVCEESDLPSTLDNSTIYAITDSGEAEIEKLIIRGMEFAGGGGAPSTDPRIVSPIGTQIDFEGASTKTVTVRAVNLSDALTIAVTGMTANLQSISVNDAAAGVQLTLTKGQDFAGGTLRIYSSEVDKTWNALDRALPTFIHGVKLNGAQWLKTDYVPNNNTALEITFKLTQTSLTVNSSDRFFMRTATPAGTHNAFLIFPFGEVGNQKWGTIIDTQDSQNTSSSVISSTYYYADNAKIRLENGTCTYTAGGQSFQIGTGIVVPTLSDPITICGRLNNQGIEKIYNYTDVNIYEFKIWESGTLVKHYKPAIYNGVVGLYEVVNGDFISSESSTSLIALEN